ncbi:putative toxin-antitoxin system toxin component, PIN family [Thioflavicoccus mobilis]|uniref:putative toxin-antitoxin system toxin component, PIN family n=1 Tax=Thioflavicoccus mobilis TaxID=80679 RepID=UPI001C10B887|nr:putative toxin-antitoxin system toxin component, PIN family [Thioflavicoccus mobilis]
MLDTNTALSGLVWGGPPGALIDAARVGRIGLISSIPLIAELEGVLGRPKFAPALEARGIFAADLVEGYAALVEILRPAQIPPTVLRDPDDDVVLATALAGRADLVVSGDKDLTDLRRFRNIAIIDAVAAQALLPPAT